MWWCLLAVDAYALSLNVVGALLVCLAIGVVLYFIWHRWLDGQSPMFFAFEHEDDAMYEGLDDSEGGDCLPPVTAMFQHLTLEQLLDEAVVARAKTQSIKAAICQMFGVDRTPLNREDSDLYDRILAAVYAGQGHSALMREYHLRANQKRSKPEPVSARAVS